MLLQGMGDNSGGFDTSFLAGSTLMAFIAGIGIIVAAKTVFAPEKRTLRKWVDGAWRRMDYESRSSDFGIRPHRKRRGRA